MSKKAEAQNTIEEMGRHIMKKILFIVGSLREKSFNGQLAAAAAEELKGKAEVSFLSYGEIPFMNQDIEFPAPESILRVRREAEEADGIWIVTPEYNHSYPGVLKNLLDWLSRPRKPNDYAGGSSVTGKKAAISGVAGKSAASEALSKLRELLGKMGMKVMEQQTGVSINREAWIANELMLSEDAKRELAQQAEQFLAFLEE